MRILFVTGAIGGGGAERVLCNLSNQFVKRNIEVDIATVFSDKTTYQLDGKVVLHHLRFISTPFINRFYSIIQLRKLIVRLKPDVVVSFLDQISILMGVVYIIPIKSSKLVFSERNDPSVEPTSRRQRKIRDWAYRKACGVVYQTDGEMKYFENKLPQNTLQTVIENPIKPGLPHYNASFDSKIFIAAGRLYHQKNYRMMIDAFYKVVRKGYKEYRLHIYGKGELSNELNEYISSLSMENYIKIYDFSNEIHKLMSESAGYLLSSDYEGISNSMLEALAIGVPVVSTDYPSGGARMYIKKGETGYLVNCGDSDAFANAIIDIISSRSHAIEMAEHASIRMKNLTVDNITTQWVDFLENVIK